MDKAVARQLSKLMLEYAAKLDESVSLVLTNCSQEEVTKYRIAVGKIMGGMLLDIMNPLYAEHPDLRPPQLK